MKRLYLPVLVFPFCLVFAEAADDSGTQKTITFLQKLQTSTGGFLAMSPQPNIRLAPTLKATSSATRAIHYLGGSIPNKQECFKFVANCYDVASGGFADMPRGKPDVFTTAVGIMAVCELGMPTDKYAAGVSKFLSENAKGFDDIRIAAAGFERLGQKAPIFPTWLAEVQKLQNKDGTFAKGLGQARDTGSGVVTILRLGGQMANSADIIKILQDGQLRDGGFGKEITGDLETSYRIMRCFVMLKARPRDVDGLRSFLARCRNNDGGYGVSPNQTSTVNGTYFAAIIKHWLDQK